MSEDVDLVDGDPQPDLGGQGARPPSRPTAGSGPGASGRSQKSSPSQAGWVKWCRVTSGLQPRLDAAVHDGGVPVEGALVDPLPSGPPEPTRCRAGSCRTPVRRPGRGPLRAGPRSRPRCPTARPGPPAPRPASCWPAPRPVEAALDLEPGGGHPEQEARREDAARSPGATLVLRWVWRWTARCAPYPRSGYGACAPGSGPGGVVAPLRWSTARFGSTPDRHDRPAPMTSRRARPRADAGGHRRPASRSNGPSW